MKERHPKASTIRIAAGALAVLAVLAAVPFALKTGALRVLSVHASSRPSESTTLARREGRVTPASRQNPAPTTSTAPAKPAAPDPLDTWQEQDGRYWRGLAEQDVFGRLRIDRIGVDVTVRKGASDADLKLGPGWLEDTDLPGSDGNVAIGGHRTIHTAPFRRLGELGAGDVITLRSPYRVYTYRVFRKFVVTPDEVHITDYTQQPTLTLFACHPPGSESHRIVVQAHLTGVEKL